MEKKPSVSQSKTKLIGGTTAADEQKFYEVYTAATAPATDTAKVKELLTQAVSEAEFKNAIRAAELIREALKLLG